MAEVTNESAVGDVQSAWPDPIELSGSKVADPASLFGGGSRYFQMPRQSGLSYLWRDHSPALPELSRTRSAQLALKRFSDIGLAIVGLLVLAPLLIGVAVAIKLTSRGPVLFTQTRPGRGGRHFNVYKFRTMYSERGDLSGIRQTTVNDGRVTPLGRFMRQKSIDELPQLMNVLLGDMAIIGPRPHPVNMLAAGRDYRELVPYYDLRCAMRPGISGWAQANGYRGPTDDPVKARARIDHDIAYIQNFSLVLDAKIILMTVMKEFISGSGF